MSKFYLTDSCSKVTPIKFASGYQFFNSFNISPIYSQTKQDIKNLRYILVITDVRRNKANWACSFEIKSPTVHRFNCPFYLYSREQMTISQDLPKLEIYVYDTLEWLLGTSVTYLCFLCMFTNRIGSPLYFNAFNL